MRCTGRQLRHVPLPLVSFGVRQLGLSSRTLKLDVFGRLVLVVESNDGWAAFHLGAEGKKRPAKDIVVPADIPESEIEQYLADLCHEWVTEQHPNVNSLD